MVDETVEQRRARKKRLKLERKARKLGKGGKEEKSRVADENKSNAEKGNGTEVSPVYQNGDHKTIVHDSRKEVVKRESHKKKKKKKGNRIEGQKDDEEKKGREKTKKRIKKKRKRRHEDMSPDAEGDDSNIKADGEVQGDEKSSESAKKRRRRQDTDGPFSVDDLDGQEGEDVRVELEYSSSKPCSSSNTDENFSGLLGFACCSLLSPKQVQQLSAQAQKKYTAGVTDVCSHILHALDELLVSVSKYQVNATIEEMVLADMARTKKLPLHKAFREITLWRRVARTTGLAGEMAEGVLGQSNENKDLLIESYLEDITAKCENELQQLREKEEVSPKKVRFLLSCLRAGASVYANLKFAPSDHQK